MSDLPDHGLALLTPAEMNAADAATIRAGTPGVTLMEAAGQAVFRTLVQAFPHARSIAILCGPGNNGGDGFVLARLLKEAGYTVKTGLLGDIDALHGDAERAFFRWTGETLPADQIGLDEADLIVDALFGAGLSRPPEGAARDLIAAMNATAIPKLSIDLPSGLSGETGQPLGIAVRADVTITFFRRKPGHLLSPGRDYCGKLCVEDIGIPASVLSDLKITLAENQPAVWQDVFPGVKADGHKYHRGHAVIISGGEFTTGASRLTAQAALRVGAGLVTIAGQPEALRIHAAHVTAIMLRPCVSIAEYNPFLADPRIRTLALGPGLGMDGFAGELVDLALRSGKSLILDADALTLLSTHEKHLSGRLKNLPSPPILTPHEGEFLRLFPAIDHPGKVERARAAAHLSHAVIVYKGPDTVIASPDGRALINTNAPPWLATAGSGDTLAGIITGLSAQGMPPFEAAAAGVWLHGRAATRLGRGMTADDLDRGLAMVLRDEPWQTITRT